MYEPVPGDALALLLGKAGAAVAPKYKMGPYVGRP